LGREVVAYTPIAVATPPDVGDEFVKWQLRASVAEATARAAAQ
jgi:hypothetical protein